VLGGEKERWGGNFTKKGKRVYGREIEMDQRSWVVSEKGNALNYVS